MMISFDSNALEMFPYDIVIAVIATIIAAFILEHILTWHKSRIITVQKRSDEFIKLSKRWYMPLALAAGAIAGETDSADKMRRPEVLFFKLAKFLSLYSNFLNSSVGYIFPKETQENKVFACADVFNRTIYLLVFNNDKKLIERTSELYRKNSDFLSFINGIGKLPEYNAVKSASDNEKIRDMLYKHANEFTESITEGVTEAYKAWYKFEFNKQDIIQKVHDSEERRTKRIKELHREL